MPIASAHHQGGQGPNVRLKRDENADQYSQSEGVQEDVTEDVALVAAVVAGWVMGFSPVGLVRT